MAEVLALAAAATGLWVGGTGGLAFLPYDIAYGAGDAHDGAPVATGWTSTATGWTSAVSALCLTEDGCLLIGGADTIARWSHAGVPAPRLPDPSGTPATPEPARVPAAIGPVSTFAALPDRTLLAGTLGDGVVRSSDGGRSWQRSGFGLASHEVNCLFVTADGAVLAGTAKGLHRARAGGRAWQLCPGSDGAPVAALTHLPDGKGLVAVTEDGCLLRSRDGGTHWTRSGDVPEGATALLAMHGGLVLATEGEGVHHSRDAGATWAPTPPHRALRTVHCLAVTTQAVHVGTDRGVAVSSGPGLPWQALVPATPYITSREHA
ncbi:WD40/YVTN/BNR-like repeat-containing protein [Streptomyces jeddahensis]|uniref:BNR/Asp-box repeat protein n=1 Tax=Streptomyces jeddahensis TaxID=1716141 RepID=A0A177HQ48_9ACTN|nr:hypothetical protein [Streptomyces jeddahensis]OAH12334.1 BNR/Asp-box repeat protein [Streptomyces jeddahensis]